MPHFLLLGTFVSYVLRFKILLFRFSDSFITCTHCNKGIRIILSQKYQANEYLVPKQPLSPSYIHWLKEPLIGQFNKVKHWRTTIGMVPIKQYFLLILLNLISRSESEKGSYVNRSPIFLSKSLLILKVKQMSSWMDVFHISCPWKSGGKVAIPHVYNRGRRYIKDFAAKMEIQVVENIQDAIVYAEKNTQGSKFCTSVPKLGVNSTRHKKCMHEVTAKLTFLTNQPAL